MKEQWKVILLIVSLIFVVVFALQNTSNVAIDLLVTSFQVPLVLVILFSLLLGVIIGLLSSMAAIQANRKDNKKLTKEIETLKSDYQGQLNVKNDKIRQLHEDLDSQKHVSTYQVTSQTSNNSATNVMNDTHDIHDSLEAQKHEESSTISVDELEDLNDNDNNVAESHVHEEPQEDVK